MAEREEARMPAGLAPQLLVVLDTEEEFDWNAPFDSKATSVEAMSDLGRLQELCDEFGIRPTYVVDHPVASQETGRHLLREFIEQGADPSGPVLDAHDPELRKAGKGSLADQRGHRILDLAVPDQEPLQGGGLEGVAGSSGFPLLVVAGEGRERRVHADRDAGFFHPRPEGVEFGQPDRA